MGLFSRKKDEELVERTFGVKGMMCSHCEMNVCGRLRDIEGVRNVRASSALGKVTVRSTPQVTEEMISSTITAAGYTVVDCMS